jgi:hypothetical protein
MNYPRQHNLPAQGRFQHQPSPHADKPRHVTTAKFFWLNMSVGFTSTSGEQKQGVTLVEQFPLLIRGAWSGLTGPLVQFVSGATGVPLSTLPVQGRTYWGNTVLAHPLNIWRKPYLLPGNTSLRCQFTNTGAEAAGNVNFMCERPDQYSSVQVHETQYYILHLDLGLTGGATQTGNASTQQIEYDLLIYGALSTSTGMTCTFLDTMLNQRWSAQNLDIGSFAGVSSGSTNVQPIMYYPTPYFLPRQDSIRVDWVNAGAESGKFVEFICERIMR